jgi:glucose/mannose-6-phosphate isomerase
MQDPYGESRVSKVDRSDVYSSYEDWPGLAERGFSASVDVPSMDYLRVAVIGMGGSASTGDIIAGWLAAKGGPEVSVFKGHLPKLDPKDTLVISCSASGGTVETIQMTKAAMDQGLTVVTVSSGGRLREMARARNGLHIDVPEAKAPRYMLPFMLFACIGVADTACRLSAKGEIGEALGALKKTWAGLRVDVPPARNGAKALAAKLRGSTPKVYGTRVTRGVGVRFCNAVNENAKANAFFEEVPEALHNDVESWETPGRGFTALMLSCSGDEPGLQRRMGWFASAIKRKGAAVASVEGVGSSALSQMVSMVYTLDMASYYMAVARGVDPLPTGLLTSLRHRLGSS